MELLLLLLGGALLYGTRAPGPEPGTGTPPSGPAGPSAADLREAQLVGQASSIPVVGQAVRIFTAVATSKPVVATATAGAKALAPVGTAVQKALSPIFGGGVTYDPTKGTALAINQLLFPKVGG